MYKIQNIFLLLFTSLLFLLNTSPIKSKEIKIFEGEAFNQELEKTIETKKKLFLIFFAKNCDYCGYSIRILKERVITHYEDDDNILFGVINLDRQSNYWNGYKFNITQIPFFVLIEGGKMYRYIDAFEEMKVCQFINEEKNVEDALDIPEDVGIIKKVNFFMASLIRNLSEFFGKFGFNNTWSNAFSCIVIILIFVSFIYFEHKLLNSIRNGVNYLRNWKKDKKEKEENKTEKNGKIKEENDNKPKND